MSRFVLVHGAWHGAWCWHKVVAELQRRGHEVQAVDLPGHGIDHTPAEEISLDAYAEKVGQVLVTSDEPAILVGHSMGGLVISEAAERFPNSVERLVYLCAFMPRPGAEPGEAQAALAGSQVPSVIVPNENRITANVNPERVKEVFYADCSDEDVALAKLCVVPQRMDVTVTQPSITVDGWGRVPRSYVVCTQDKAITEEAQRNMIEAVGCDHVVDLQTSHSPFFSAPVELADALEVS